MDGAKLLEAGILLLRILSTKGMPSVMKWADGTELDDITDEGLDALKVKRMSDKRAESEE